MKKSFIVLNLTILSLILVSFFPIQAQNCGTGNTRSSNYIQRDNDKRCEGIAPATMEYFQSDEYEIIAARGRKFCVNCLYCSYQKMYTMCPVFLL